MRRIALVCALSAACFVTASGVRAEERTSDVRLANELYKSGHERVKSDDWEGARDAFARAWALYPQPVILANLAGAEVQTGRLVEATEHYRQLFKNTTGLSPAEVEIAKKAMERVEARLPHLRVTVANLRAADAVEIDGAPLPRAALDADYPVDPGTHVVRVVRDGSEEARGEVALAEGETKALRLVAPSVTAAPAPLIVTRPRAGDERGGIFGSPWFWVATGVVVVGAGAAVCLAAVCRSDDAYSGNLGAVTLP